MAFSTAEPRKALACPRSQHSASAGPWSWRISADSPPKLVNEHLEQAIRAAENQRFGLTAAEREKKLAEIDEELALIEEEHSGMVAAAAELGVQLALLDAVRERRETEEAEERSQWIPTVHGAVGMGGG